MDLLKLIEFLKKNGVAVALGLIGGILFNEWIDPPTVAAYIALLAIATLLIVAIIIGIAKIFGN